MKQTHPMSIVKNRSVGATTDSCWGRYIYIYDDLPAQFNYDLTNNCESLTGCNMPNMCPYIQSFGFGPEVKNSLGVLTHTSWFSTNQFTLELVFNSKMKHYECLTNNSAQASAIYIPIYPGLEDSKHLWDPNLTATLSVKSFPVGFQADPKGRKCGGETISLFQEELVSTIGGKQITLLTGVVISPESNNMTMLAIEGSSRRNDIAMPYPTGFHPANDSEALEWQNEVRGEARPYLFTFVGAPRPNQTNSIRGKHFDQCQASTCCKVLNCHSSGINCEEIVTVMRVFQKSVYCLQPIGDTYTRKSASDSILAGCIPVFFHPASAYNQYTKYSVFIPVKNVTDLQDGSIGKTLLGVSKDRESAMREQVTRLIPRLIYGDPRSRLHTKDAFDISVNKIFERIKNVRNVIKQGRDPSVGFADPDGNKFLFPEDLKQI